MEKGFLHLTTPQSLFEKLEHDYALLQNDNMDAYKAFNFFVTAEHLPDWVGNVRIKDNDPFLRISSHLATGAKHFDVTNPKKNSIEGGFVDVYVEDGYVEDGYIETVLSLKLTEKEAEEIGAPYISVMSLAQHVLSFWRNYFNAQST